MAYITANANANGQKTSSEGPASGRSSPAPNPGSSWVRVRRGDDRDLVMMEGRRGGDVGETERDPPGATAHAGPTKRGPYCS